MTHHTNVIRSQIHGAFVVFTSGVPLHLPTTPSQIPILHQPTPTGTKQSHPSRPAANPSNLDHRPRMTHPASASAFPQPRAPLPCIHCRFCTSRICRPASRPSSSSQTHAADDKSTPSRAVPWPKVRKLNVRRGEKIIEY